MSSFRSEPILWIHLAGLAALPICLEVCTFGLALSKSLLPGWIEISIIATLGAIPILWMQLTKPFYIFAILAVAVKQEKLTSEQRKILTLINTRLNRVLSVVAAVLLVGVLGQLHRIAPLLATPNLFPTQGQIVGLLLASLAFLASNLFLQVPISVIRVFVTSDAEFAIIVPYPLEKIVPDFTILGLQVNRILPRLGADTVKNDD